MYGSKQGLSYLPGITIGENAIVWAGGVVTHDVEANTMVAGNPAKLIKKIAPDKFEYSVHKTIFNWSKKTEQKYKRIHMYPFYISITLPHWTST